MGTQIGMRTGNVTHTSHFYKNFGSSFLASTCMSVFTLVATGKPPHDTPKYGLLFAARAGCLQCVKYWVEDMNVDVFSASDHHGNCGAEYYAESGGSAGQASVLQYLRDRKRKDFPEVPNEDAVPPSAFFGAYLADAFKTQSPARHSSVCTPPRPSMDVLPCSGVQIHSISHNPVDRLASAAWDGCLSCVRYLMITLEVDPTETPEFLAPFRMNARDGSLYGASLQRPMCAEVHLCIEDHLLEMSRKATSRESSMVHHAPACLPLLRTITPHRERLHFVPRPSTRKKRRRQSAFVCGSTTAGVAAPSQGIAFHYHGLPSYVDNVYLVC